MPTSLAPSRAPERGARPLTGRSVALALVAFFAVVFAVNAVMVRAALSTFGGVEKQTSYAAGLAFGREVAASERQNARHWAVDARLSPVRDGRAEVSVRARDADGRALTGLVLEARLAHPVDGRRDHIIALSEAGAGLYRGSAEAAPGAWDLVMDLKRGDERLFRSKSRISLR